MKPRTADNTDGKCLLDVSDPSRTRMILLYEVEAHGDWADVFNASSGWRPGPLSVRGQQDNIYTPDHRRANFHPHVANQLLADQVRSHKCFVVPEELRIHGPKEPVATVHAMEVLRSSVHGDENMGILVLHTEIHSNYEMVHRLVREHSYQQTLRRRVPELIVSTKTAAALGPDIGGLHIRALGDSQREYSPPVVTVVWLPRPEPISDSALASGGASTSSADERAAATGWQWSTWPNLKYQVLDRRTLEHALNATLFVEQRWAITMSEHGIAYACMGASTSSAQGLDRMHTLDLDVYLLLMLSRAEVLRLSGELADVARSLSKAPPSSIDTKATRTQESARNHRSISKALDVDARATAFLAGQWWTDASYVTRVDQVLEKAQEVWKLDDAVNQVVQQARMLRETLQTMIDREEQKSTRAMERALAFLAFYGIPLSLFLELWVNFYSLTGTQLPASVPWGVWLATVVVASAGVGYLLWKVSWWILHLRRNSE